MMRFTSCVSRAGFAALLLGSTLAGCTFAPAQAPVGSQHDGLTLGDLERQAVDITPQSLAHASPEAAMDHYRHAIALLPEPEQRARPLRRMADLAMNTAEYRAIEDTDGAGSGTTLAEHERDIDRMLYESFIREAKNSNDREQRFALLGLAGSLHAEWHGSDDAAGLETDFRTAVMLYRALLDSTRDPRQRADAWYQLAKAYDFGGDLDGSLAALGALVREHADSEFYAEAQFRRGELLFARNAYDEAAAAYAAVLARPENDFTLQALYKLGWSHYKLANYSQALAQFFQLADRLHGHASLTDTASMQAKLLGDTHRAISLAFTNLDGAVSVRDWFAEHGTRAYEADIYRRLGELYLHQQRYRDAADSYDMFVSQYPDDPRAPTFSSLQIDAFRQGGFPTLVLPAKEQFVQRYGIHSRFWAAQPAARESYIEVLKGHILDLAQHYHAQAQQHSGPAAAAAYAAPLRWYREYLDTPPPDDDQPIINHRYAEALYAAGEHAGAVAEFERTAYQYSDYADADAAGYFALVAYQARLAALPTDTPPDAIAQLRREKIASGLRFAATWPTHAQATTVLVSVSEDQLALGDVAGAVATAGLLVNRTPAPAAEQLRYGWATIANGEFDLGRYPVAEYAYSTLLAQPGLGAQERTTYQERLAASIYRQAEALLAADNKAEAAAMFLRVGTTVASASIRKQAEYDAAALLLELADYSSAARVLEDFRRRYAEDALAATVPDKLALAYENMGDFLAAARELELIADSYTESDPELASQALWQAAEMADRAEQPMASISLYRKYAWAYPEPIALRAEAQYRLAGLYQQLGDQDRHAFWLDRLVLTAGDAAEAATPRIAWLGAWAAFALAEPQFASFSEIRLTQPLRRSLERKTAAMRTALRRYEAVAALQVAEFATAANYRIGDMYRQLAQDILHSERPRNLDELELELYELMLEEQALPYEDMAIDVLIANTDLAPEGIYDDWVRQSFAALGELLPGRFAKFEQVETYVDIIY